MDNAELQQAIDDLGHGIEEFKKTHTEELKQYALTGHVDSLIKEKMDKLQETIETRQVEIDKATKASADALKAHDEKIEELETALSRACSSTPDPKMELELRSQACELIRTDHFDQGQSIDLAPEDVDDKDLEVFKVYRRHFMTYLRRDSDAFLKKMGMPALETRLLSVDRDPGGGYWVKPEMSARIMKIIFETSPVREFATVESIASDSLELITDENQAGFGWVAEQESRPETTTPDIGKRVIHAHELYAEPRVTQKLLDDAGFDVERWLSNKVAERFARAEATAFVSGTGVGRPRGIDTYPSGTSAGQIEQINSGTSGAVTADGLMDLIYSLKGPYLRNARYMAARLTIRDVRKLKDGQGNYLWERNFQVGQPLNILGYPMHQADDVAAVAGGSLSIIFGDFKIGYTVVERLGTRVLRDPFTTKPFIKLYTTRRVGGDVVNFEALKLQVLT